MYSHSYENGHMLCVTGLHDYSLLGDINCSVKEHNQCGQSWYNGADSPVISVLDGQLWYRVFGFSLGHKDVPNSSFAQPTNSAFNEYTTVHCWRMKVTVIKDWTRALLRREMKSLTLLLPLGAWARNCCKATILTTFINVYYEQRLVRRPPCTYCVFSRHSHALDFCHQRRHRLLLLEKITNLPESIFNVRPGCTWLRPQWRRDGDAWALESFPVTDEPPVIQIEEPTIYGSS